MPFCTAPWPTTEPLFPSLSFPPQPPPTLPNCVSLTALCYGATTNQNNRVWYPSVSSYLYPWFQHCYIFIKLKYAEACGINSGELRVCFGYCPFDMGECGGMCINCLSIFKVSPSHPPGHTQVVKREQGFHYRFTEGGWAGGGGETTQLKSVHRRL